jgi:hypothetical protein
VEFKPRLCLLGVNRVVLIVRRPLPVYPNKRTFAGCVGMSQKCQNQKSSTAWVMFR